MKPLKKRIARRSGYLAMLLAVLVLSGCGIGRYNDHIASNVYATNTTYFYSTNGNLVGSATSYK